MKKQILSLAFAVVFVAGAYAQNNTTIFHSNQSNESQSIATIIDQAKKESSNADATAAVTRRPQFPGGMKALVEYMAQNIQYPEVARENGYEGTVKIQFIVLPDGSVTGLRIIKSVNEFLDASALALVENMPRWEPALQMGRAVRTRMDVPIQFTLR